MTYNLGCSQLYIYILCRLPDRVKNRLNIPYRSVLETRPPRIENNSIEDMLNSLEISYLYRVVSPNCRVLLR